MIEVSTIAVATSREISSTPSRHHPACHPRMPRRRNEDRKGMVGRSIRARAGAGVMANSRGCGRSVARATGAKSINHIHRAPSPRSTATYEPKRGPFSLAKQDLVQYVRNQSSQMLYLPSSAFFFWVEVMALVGRSRRRCPGSVPRRNKFGVELRERHRVGRQRGPVLVVGSGSRIFFCRKGNQVVGAEGGSGVFDERFELRMGLRRHAWPAAA